jgi:membrane associated rhomboid family serine protease
MAHHHEEEKKEEVNFNALYYLVGLLSGLFVGVIIDKGYTWIFVGGVLGLLTAALFLSVFVRGREQR